LAAVAAVSTSFAQVSITGGVDFTFGKSADGTKGLANTDACIDITATEDLGGGLTAIAAMEFNADGSSWKTISAGTKISGGDSAYPGDKSFTLKGSSGSLTLANARSGGILNAVMLAPVVSGDDHWSPINATVMERSNVDVLSISLPAMSGVTLGYKYVEGGDSYGTPLNVTHVLGAKYASGPLTVAGEYNIRQSEYIGADKRNQRIDATVAYDAGVAKVALGIETANLNTANSTTTGRAGTLTLLSASVPVGNHLIGVNYGKRDAASFTEFGGQYNFSKQTFLAASVGSFTSQEGLSSDAFGVRLGKSF